MTLVAVDLAFSCCACTPKLLERLMKFCACLVWKCLAAAIKECVSMHAQQAHLCPWILQWLQPRVEAWESGNEYTVLDWGGLLKSSVEESEVPDGEESSESRLLHSLQMRERERVQKERLRDVIQWKSCLSNPIFIFFPELGWNGALPVYCPVLFLTSNFISLMFFVWWPSCGTGFLLLRAEGRHCFWFLFFLSPYCAVFGNASRFYNYRDWTHSSIRCCLFSSSLEMRASLFSMNWGGPPFWPSFNPKLARNCKY